MKRAGRLASAKHWLPTYSGKHIVAGYAKWYGVDLLCAVAELKLLGVPVAPSYEAQLRQTLSARAGKKRRSLVVEPVDTESDFNLAYVAGYTSGGCPFGIPWDELDGLYRTADDGPSTDEARPPPARSPPVDDDDADDVIPY